jgi:hypothetical protein
MTHHRLTRSAASVPLLLALATVATVICPCPSSAAVWPEAARSTAAAAARGWAAEVPIAARLGAEPAGRCRALDATRAACPIAIALLADDAAGRRPWRCSATVVVSRAARRVTARRTATRCTAFPPRARTTDPAAVFGTAFALDAVGDVACLPATPGRATCVMRYAAPTGERCVRAASVPLAVLARSRALGPALCQSS